MRRLCFHRSRLVKGKHFNNHLQSAWNRDGDNAFTYFIVEYCENVNLEKREEFYIQHFKASNREYGYNKSDSAYSSMRGRTGSLNPLFGRKRPESAMKAFREASMGANHYKAKAVNQYQKDGVFVRRWSYICEAEKALGIANTHISGSCLRKESTAGSYFWRYASDPIQVDWIKNDGSIKKRRELRKEWSKLNNTTLV